MVNKLGTGLLSTLVCAMLLSAAPGWADQQRIRCKSKDHEYEYCRAQTDRRVELVRQHSRTRCREGENWGYDRHGVWVDRGCDATFLVGKRGGGSHRDRASQTIRCRSDDRKYRYCRVRTDNRVALVQQHSKTRCREGKNWGFDRNGVWVDDGCDAEFRVGGSGRDRHDRDDGSGAAVAAGAALAGIAIIAALSSHSDQHETDVPSWAVGTFRGYDDLEKTDLEVTVLPGGSVTGYADRDRFTGTLEGERLVTGRHRFTISRSGNGFLATDEGDSRRRIMFRRTGSGY